MTDGVEDKTKRTKLNAIQRTEKRSAALIKDANEITHEDKLFQTSPDTAQQLRKISII